MNLINYFKYMITLQDGQKVYLFLLHILEKQNDLKFAGSGMAVRMGCYCFWVALT